MSLNLSSHPRALPRRFRQPRLLLVGCGDVATRIAKQISTRYRIKAMLRHDNKSASWQEWRRLGATPFAADLDNSKSLKRVRGLATHVIYLAPPADNLPTDQRLNRFLAAIHSGNSLPRRTVLISTSGVYGDYQGAKINEAAKRRPSTARAIRRVSAENTLRHWARSRILSSQLMRSVDQLRTVHNSGSILRTPGIYAENRLPVERIKSGTPAIKAHEDSWTNHIHANDLARICTFSLARGHSLRAYNATDSSNLKMGDWFDAIADTMGLAKPNRISRSEIKEHISPMLYSFMSESRQLDNHRMLTELRIKLLYPTVFDFLKTIKVS